MFTRKDIQAIGEKLANSSVSDEIVEQVDDLLNTCYDAQAGIRACNYMLKTEFFGIDLEPCGDFYEALETLNAVIGLFEIDRESNLDNVRDDLGRHLKYASAELEDIIKGTELELDGMWGWEDYDKWCEIRSEAAEQFEDLDDDIWIKEYQKLSADMFFKQPLMWFFDNKVDETLAKSTRIDDLRTYIAKNTTHDIYRQRFAEYA